jgi:mannose-6-phosphate isomerase-like protein (cupin superfamily)
MNRVEKPWGYELHWAKTDKYVGKLIHVNAGHALSLQYHNQKDETIFLWSGRMLFEIKEGDELVKREMKPGEAVHVTPKTVHRMTAIEDCDIFEVSTPELHDVVRLEDRYGPELLTTVSPPGARRAASQFPQTCTRWNVVVAATSPRVKNV